MSGLIRVPEEMSFTTEIVDDWKSLTPQIANVGFDGNLWSGIEKSIQEGWKKFKQGELKPEYDWEHDLLTAERFHHLNLRWAKNVGDTLAETGDIWGQSVEDLRSFSRELSMTGIKFAFLAHGAVGIGCLGFLGQNNNGTATYYVAVGCILGSVIGIGLLAVGGTILVKTAAAAASHIRSRIGRQLTFKRLRFLSRVWERKITPSMDLAEHLIFGSIFWLIAYIAIAAVSLLSS